MKIAPLLFGAALTIFLTTIAASKYLPASISETRKALDFTGIDTLEIKAEATAKIKIADNADASVSFEKDSDYYRETEGPELLVKTVGSRMTITSGIESYVELNLVIPPEVKNLIVQNADIESHSTPGNMSVHVSNSLVWRGDASSLRIVDSRNYSNSKKGCASNIEIQDGKIESLSVETLEGNLTLKSLEQIKATALQVGPKATLSFSPIGGIKTIQLTDLPEPIARPPSAANEPAKTDSYACGDDWRD